MDNIVDAPLRLQRRVEQLKSGKQGGVWSFEYDDWARTDRERFVIYVQPGHSDVSTASQFTHEVGHAMFYPSIDWSSRDAYIRSSCADEGAAVAENIVSKDTIKLCLGIDMPLTTADEETVTEKYRELASRPPLNYAELGYFFCERNIASGLNESYLDYYGRAFDEHAKEKH